MAINFPTSKDDGTSLPNPSGTNTQNSPDHAGLHTNENAAIIAVETKVGTGSSTPTSGTVLAGSGTGTSAWSSSLSGLTLITPTLTTGGTWGGSPTITSPTINSPVITNASITVDTISGYTTSNSGSIYGISVSTGQISSALTLTSTLAVNSTLSTTGQMSIQTTTAPPAAGATTSGIKVSSTANFGIFWGSGAPTFSAAQGSIYLRTDGSSTSTRLYVNTTGSTTWTNFTSAA
jgi:hypothetical protein